MNENENKLEGGVIIIVGDKGTGMDMFAVQMAARIKEATGRKVIVAETLGLPYQRELGKEIALEATKFEVPDILIADNNRRARRELQYGKSDNWKRKNYHSRR